MITLQKRRSTFSRMAIIFLILLVIFPVSSSFISASPVQATNDWAGWAGISKIYYNLEQEDANNNFLGTAATELQTYLGQMSGRSFTITHTYPAAPAVYLSVDTTKLASYGDEAFNLTTDNNGVTITGKTALACREGAYYLLNELGVRWFFKSDTWTVVPASLANLGSMDEVHEPFFNWRMIETDGTVGTDASKAWNMRNFLFGSNSYVIYHSYADILDYSTNWSSKTKQQKVDYGNAHPDYFLPNDRYPYTIDGDSDRPDSYPWQLNPANEDVIAMAISYARHVLGSPTPSAPIIGADDNIYPRVVSISPNDGGGWNPPYSLEDDIQDITDLAFGLVNAVADNISGDYPNDYVGIYSYSVYSAIPSFALEPNVMVHVATDFNNSPLQLFERTAGISAQGATVGIRDYLDIWEWNADAPSTAIDRIKDLTWYAKQGIKYYNGEASDGWCAGGGLDYYLAAKMLYDPTQDVDTLLSDFYIKAFGPAAPVMQHYYETRSTDNVSLAMSFRDLDEAETLAVGNASVLARIRQLEDYNRYMWFTKNIHIANLTTEQLEGYYTFITKTRDLYVVSYFAVEPTLRAALIARGLTTGQVNALQDFTPPTPTEDRAWLDEALDFFESTLDPTPSIYTNPREIDLTALGDNVSTPLTPLSGHFRDILVPSAGNENITVLVKGEYGTIQWYRPTGLMIDSYAWSSPLTEWTPVVFATTTPGTYILHITRAVPTSSYCQIDIQNHAASILADPNQTVFVPTGDWLPDNGPSYQGANSQYFYVPTGTASFTFGAAVAQVGRPAYGKLTDPNAMEYSFSWTATDSMTITSPVAGLWKIDINMLTTAEEFWLIGIPPLVWHDPEYLLVPAADDSPAPPMLNHIGAKVVHTGQLLQFTVSATDSNVGPLTYSASNIPSWATFNPATRVFSGTPSQTGTYTNVQFTVSDGSLTDSEAITITVDDARNGPDINNDGVVNILDMISIVQHWGQSGVNGWIPEDVNENGSVDILDVILIGQYWTG